MENLKGYTNWKWREWILPIIKNLLIIFLVGYLFYGSFLAGLMGMPIIILLMKKDREKEERRRKDRLRLEFREALLNLRAALRSGYSVENATTEVLRSLQAVYGGEAPIVKEFRYMSNELRMQVPVEKVWRKFAERTMVKEIENFAGVLQIAKRSGGNLIAVIDQAADLISRQLEVKQEIDTVLAGKKAEWRVMTLIPFGIIFYMKLSFPEFMESMYGNIAGILTMTVALAICITAMEMGNRIIDIKM